MRRAITFLLIVLAAAALYPGASSSDAPPSIINGIGLVDYARKPSFKVGDWVRYHMTGKSELGVKSDYTVTVAVVGEQDFWGDPAFWLETWTEVPDRAPETYAALMSYDIFGDSSATERLQLYMRAAISQLNEDGTPRIDINKPAASMLKTRREVKNPVRWSRDTLGTDTVSTPVGDYKTLKVLLKQGTGATQTVGDSSIYTEVRENRTSWYVNEVPITHLAKEDVESSSSRKAWLLGRSGEATPLMTRDRGLGTARLVAFGHDAKARLVPERFRRTIAEQAMAGRAEAKPRAASAGGKPAPARPRR